MSAQGLPLPNPKAGMTGRLHSSRLLPAACPLRKEAPIHRHFYLHIYCHRSYIGRPERAAGSLRLLQGYGFLRNQSVYRQLLRFGYLHLRLRLRTVERLAVANQPVDQG
ncbi:hypothetical protein D3C71_1422710 [compost metagenome]